MSGLRRIQSFIHSVVDLQIQPSGASRELPHPDCACLGADILKDDSTKGSKASSSGTPCLPEGFAKFFDVAAGTNDPVTEPFLDTPLGVDVADEIVEQESREGDTLRGDGLCDLLRFRAECFRSIEACTHFAERCLDGGDLSK